VSFGVVDVDLLAASITYDSYGFFTHCLLLDSVAPPSSTDKRGELVDEKQSS